MTAAELLRRASECGLTLRVHGGDRLVVRGRADAIEELHPNLSALKPEIVAILREKAATASHSFTARGKLCSRCRGLARVAVIDGDLVCTFCVVAEAERLALKGTGS